MTGTDIERIPWCAECEVIAVPTDEGTCGECGRSVTYRSGRS